ncbi:hypothetical protein PY093_18575 [Cytobacillus sp. S13-E01]|uniref:hypothetical protein n=1 Tax=Cytobacillus sp. S13-E01 TaxID=3031326 RepID=UPI0023D8B19E|nr:hypothetical protein [Cytobacillus sp. S13-E01]MDF0728645.1 hypothetical protein [Cytobacillus sp. S13-E01]
MKGIRNIMWGLLIIPLLSLPFMGKRDFSRYLPSATFVSLLLALISEIAESRRWWKVKINLIPDLTTNMSFVLSTFFVGTLWVFKYSYGNFFKYLGTNFILDWIFSYPLTHLFQRMRVFRLIHFKQHYILMMFISFAIIIYWFQSTIEKAINKSYVKEAL